MSIQFVTCDRRRALEFIRRSWPKIIIEDTPKDAKPILDLIEADIIRIGDPDYHPVGMIVPGKNYKADEHLLVIDVCQSFNQRCAERDDELKIKEGRDARNP